MDLSVRTLTFYSFFCVQQMLLFTICNLINDRDSDIYHVVRMDGETNISMGLHEDGRYNERFEGWSVSDGKFHSILSRDFHM